MSLILSRAGVLASGAAAAWTPAELFAASENGAWYDPSDLSTLWQDTAGTTPVTADGQTVARMDDKSGNGFHQLQANASLRPLYKTSGGVHWLQFDGVDDYMSTAANTSMDLDPFYLAIAADEILEGTNKRFISFAGVSGFDFEGPDRFSLVSGDASNWFDLGSNSSFTSVLVAGSGPTPLRVLDFINVSGELELFVNGVSSATRSGTTMTVHSGKIFIGCRSLANAANANYLDGRWYGAIIRSAVTSSGDAGSARAWLADNVGITL